jgi:hypothetical protein
LSTILIFTHHSIIPPFHHSNFNFSSKMEKVGKSLPYELWCTALGGLSITKTSKKIEEQLARGGAF